MDLGLLTYISKKSASRRFSWCNSQLLTPSGRRAMKDTVFIPSLARHFGISISISINISIRKSNHDFPWISVWNADRNVKGTPGGAMDTIQMGPSVKLKDLSHGTHLTRKSVQKYAENWNRELLRPSGVELLPNYCLEPDIWIFGGGLLLEE